jgi:hypothetical protein
MDSDEPVSRAEIVLCECQGEGYIPRDVIDYALFRGKLSEPWQTFLREFATAARADELDLESDDDLFDQLGEAFRYRHDLITAEETERWLQARNLNLDDFSDYLVRQCWANAKIDGVAPEETEYHLAPDELRDTFTTDLILSGQLEEMARKFSWRMAARCAEKEIDPELIAFERQEFLERVGIEKGQIPEWLESLNRDEDWLDRQVAMEAAYRKHSAAVLQPQAYKRELASLRLPLTRFETEVIELESRDAAQEALFCVREDGMSFEEVADEGRYPYRRRDFFLQDLDAQTQQKFLSVGNDQLLDPIPRTEGFELCHVLKRVEPQADDPAVQGLVSQHLLARYFAELTSKYVTFPLDAAPAE